MKACKIILIFLLVIWSLLKIVIALFQDDDQQLARIVGCILGIPTIWLLFWGAGLLDF